MDAHSSTSRGAGGEARRGDSKSFSRGRGGGGRGNHRGKSRDMGRSAWSKQKGDKRKQNDERQNAKRQRRGDAEDQTDDRPLPVYATKFSEEDLKAEERRPKKKVAVLIGYSGTGYRGMQLAHDQMTIEGDLFKAFVAAGAISKANADDPKKSSFVRCARTDKGVHAAGNVISLKLIVEDADIVQKINDNLVPQIRVWGYERTNNSFSAYQLVDSRIYEYLIPTHSFLPPHPSSYMARKCAEWAERKGETEAWKGRQEEVQGFWEKVDEEMIKPILDEYDDDIRDVLQKALWLKEDITTETTVAEAESLTDIKVDAVEPSTSLDLNDQADPSTKEEGNVKAEGTESAEEVTARRLRAQTIHEGTKRLRQAYVDAKRTYRIPERRLQRIRDVLDLYVGTRNFYNYTVQKSFGDPSANRVIKSFVVSPTNNPILIDGTEWVSLKVHGQSFMMHQIRKMVGMASLIVRCGSDPQRTIRRSYGADKISIPKAPSLGLLLERPIFDSYNKRVCGDKLTNDRSPIIFDQYENQIDAFKTKFIYERMYHDEQKENVFGNFFNHIDNYPDETFLFVTSGGIEAVREVSAQNAERGGVVDQERENKKKSNQEEEDNDGGSDGSDVDEDIRDDQAGNEG